MKTDRPGPILCFGEVVLRLAAPTGMRLANAQSLAVHVGGSEANAGAVLAQLGHQTEMITVLSRSALGDQCEGELRRVGIGTSNVQRADGRQGLYFAEGGGSRSGRILYDREDSAFTAHADTFDWQALTQNAGWFHVSGINLALGGKPSDATLHAMRAMASAGVPISFDVNHRASLWEGRSPAELGRVREGMGLADVLFAGRHDLSRALGVEGANVAHSTFSVLEKVTFIASTRRSDDQQQLSAHVASREDVRETEAATLGPVIDRIGSGDAFAGAVIDAIRGGASVEDCARFGLAAAVSKHGIAGDRWIGTREDLEAFDPFLPGNIRR
jgi:2-dehydro-3-deoxygluconokinase